mmetsp:Transcript_10274/g.26610  ORF Transcript_10274/g.26610 Transcript_10274/m.26610 type:complete len:325 (+) Transcript_10274:403-1377(+)
MLGQKNVKRQCGVQPPPPPPPPQHRREPIAMRSDSACSRTQRDADEAAAAVGSSTVLSRRGGVPGPTEGEVGGEACALGACTLRYGHRSTPIFRHAFFRAVIEMPSSAAASLSGRSKSCCTLLRFSTTGSLEARADWPALLLVKMRLMFPLSSSPSSPELSAPASLFPSVECGRVLGAEVGETDPLCAREPEPLACATPVEVGAPAGSEDVRAISASWRSAVCRSEVRRHGWAAGAGSGGPARSICRICACVSRESECALDEAGGAGETAARAPPAEPDGATRGGAPGRQVPRRGCEATKPCTGGTAAGIVDGMMKSVLVTGEG